MKTHATSNYFFTIFILGLFFLTEVSYSQMMFGSDSISTQPPATYFDFSAGHGSNDSTGVNFHADFRGTSNEGTNFGAENTQIPGNRYLRFSTNGNLDTVTIVPLCTNAAPWVSVSWDWPNGTSGQPVKAGELWVVYTREGHYACMQITYTDTNSSGTPGYGTYFKFKYKYQPNGSNDLTGTIPVELTSFSASTVDNYIELRWTTASEKNNRGFEIEKSIVSWQKAVSKWETIGFVNGAGSTTEQQNYFYADKNLSNGKYFYRLKQIDFDGSFNLSDELEVNITSPYHFSLEQNYPNPFNPSTKIKYAIGNRQFATLKVFDILGNEVATLVNEVKEPGVYEINFDASNVSNGVYFYKLQTGNFSDVKKLVVIK